MPIAGTCGVIGYLVGRRSADPTVGREVGQALSAAAVVLGGVAIFIAVYWAVWSGFHLGFVTQQLEQTWWIWIIGLGGVATGVGAYKYAPGSENREGVAVPRKPEKRGTPLG